MSLSQVSAQLSPWPVMNPRFSLPFQKPQGVHGIQTANEAPGQDSFIRQADSVQFGSGGKHGKQLRFLMDTSHGEAQVFYSGQWAEPQTQHELDLLIELGLCRGAVDQQNHRVFIQDRVDPQQGTVPIQTVMMTVSSQSGLETQPCRVALRFVGTDQERRRFFPNVNDARQLSDQLESLQTREKVQLFWPEAVEDSDTSSTLTAYVVPLPPQSSGCEVIESERPNAAGFNPLQRLIYPSLDYLRRSGIADPEDTEEIWAAVNAKTLSLFSSPNGDDVHIVRPADVN